MSDLEISSLSNNQQLQSWATKCDANGDGKIDGDELSVFQQGKDNMFTKSYRHDDKNSFTIENGKNSFTIENGKNLFTIVNGVELKVTDIKTIKSNNGQTTVRTKDGIEFTYDKQADGNEASAECIGMQGSKETYFRFANFTDGKGITIKGSPHDDYFDIKNSKIGTVDGLRGDDGATLTHCVGNDGSASVFAEYGNYYDIKDVNIKPNSRKYLDGSTSSSINTNDHKKGDYFNFNLIQTNKKSHK